MSGHALGGVGVFNAVNENKNDDIIKAIFSACPTNTEPALGLEWDYDSSLISVPIFLVSGTGDEDEKLVVSGVQLREFYNSIPKTVTKIMARQTSTDHGDILSFADGYMTAWFMWQLQGDNYAARALAGNDAEILYARSTDVNIYAGASEGKTYKWTIAQVKSICMFTSN